MSLEDTKSLSVETKKAFIEIIENKKKKKPRGPGTVYDSLTSPFRKMFTRLNEKINENI